MEVVCWIRTWTPTTTKKHHQQQYNVRFESAITLPQHKFGKKYLHLILASHYVLSYELLLSFHIATSSRKTSLFITNIFCILICNCKTAKVAHYCESFIKEIGRKCSDLKNKFKVKANLRLDANSVASAFILNAIFYS